MAAFYTGHPPIASIAQVAQIPAAALTTNDGDASAK
jgi:hypothetical protein